VVLSQKITLSIEKAVIGGRLLPPDRDILASIAVWGN